MLRNVNDLRGYAINATDGVIGQVEDLYFDDEDWAIRYLIVDTGGWLPGKKVLISPLAIGHPDWMGQLLPVSLTKAQIAHSPDIDTKKPVSRQHEAEYSGYYGYPPYWGGGGIWGMGAYPGSLTLERKIEEDMQANQTPSTPPADDCHLRSGNAVIGHQVQARDGDIGHVEDALVDEHTWVIRYLIVDTSHWWGGGRHVLVSPEWIDAVNWPEAKVSVDLTCQAIKDGPLYDPGTQFDRQQEQAMHEHYGRPGYWMDKAIQATARAAK